MQSMRNHALHLLALAAFLAITPAGSSAGAIEPFPADLPGVEIGGNLPLPFEPSGAVWHPTLDRLFVVDDGGTVVSMDVNGVILEQWELSGDLEGVCVADPSTPDLYIVVEFPYAILRLDTQTGMVQSFSLDAFFSGDEQRGLEALTFVPDTGNPQGGLFYVGLQEDGKIYVMELPIVSGSPTDIFLVDVLTPVPGLTDLSGLHYNAENDLLYAVFDGANLLLALDTSGALIHEWILPGNDQEGVAIRGCELFIAEDDSEVDIWRYGGFPADALDGDSDGVTDCADDCPGTASGQSVDLQGCSCDQGGQFAVCGNGACEISGRESCITCPEDCNGAQSGNPNNRFCCGDGVGENPVDCGDSRCSDAVVACTDRTNEALAGVCEDGIDNDCDGAPDCADLDCCTVGICATPDVDGDSYGVCDCDDGNAVIWSCPGDVTVAWTLPEEISWTAPVEPGGVTVTYDVLRSQSASDFGVVAVCLESDDALDTLAMDLEVPLSGAPFFYLVRSENDCPGDGSLGIDSAGTPRAGRACP